MGTKTYRLIQYDSDAPNVPVLVVATAAQISGLISPTSADVNTTDGAQTVLATIAIPSNSTVYIEAQVSGRRTGGSSGSEGDSASYIVGAVFKNLAGTVTKVGESSIFSAEDQAAWTCTYGVTGTDATLLVTGAANNNVSWETSYMVSQLS